jgi:hypothetical protein
LKQNLQNILKKILRFNEIIIASDYNLPWTNGYLQKAIVAEFPGAKTRCGGWHNFGL